MSDPGKEAAKEAASERQRKRNNILVAAFVLALLAAGYFIVDAVTAANKAQLCIESGRRNCRVIETR